MTECFKDLLEESLTQTEMRPGAIVNARVIEIGRDFVTVDAGLKSEGVIAIQEFFAKGNELEVSIGDEVEVALDMLEDGFGETILSREKAKRFQTWRDLEKAHNANQNVFGIITDKVKGGFTVEIANVRAFLPGSLVDVRPVRDSTFLEGKELEFKVIKMDVKRNNIVVSRRAVVQEENSADRDALLESLAEGKEINGIVKNLTDYGAFIDLGGIDGLLHITDISWKRVKHPSELLSVGQELTVKVLKFDKERNRVSLGMKQMGDDPWVEVTSKFPETSKLKGKVTNVTDYGCFVEIENGIEGLVHMSEMDWTNKNIHPNKVVALGDEVNVMVLEIDQERRRISLGMKQCISNPWDDFAAEHKKGDKISGKICSITDFGVFIGLAGDIDGLVHLSDLDWNLPGEEAVLNYKKGQEIESMILAIDPERERISLGIKQLESDPFTSFTVTHSKGDTVTGKVVEVEAKYVTVQLSEEVMGSIRSSEISIDKVEDARTVINEGDEIEAKIVNIDKKNRVINLSIRAADADAEAEVMKKYSKGSTEGSVSTTLGDLLKEKMTDNQND